MSGYRRVNYYELCRLCTNSEGTKMNIFLEEGRRRQLQNKIQTYLPIQVLEDDPLPKIVCLECVQKLESFIEFREAVVGAEGMLESYFTSLRFSENFLKEGKVYVKTIAKASNGQSQSQAQEDVNKEDAVRTVATTTTEDSEPTTVVTATNNNNSQIVTTTTTNEPQQQQQQVLVSNLNASNLQIISGVQARVQQYKCAMQVCFHFIFCLLLFIETSVNTFW